MSPRERQANIPGGRSRVRKVKLTEFEDRALVFAAAEHGMTVPRFLVESALARDAGETVTERREAVTLLHRLHGQLAAIGNNINQLARHANATGDIGPDLHHSLDHLRTLVRTVRHAAGVLGRDAQRDSDVAGDGS